MTDNKLNKLLKEGKIRSLSRVRFVFEGSTVVENICTYFFFFMINESNY